MAGQGAQSVSDALKKIYTEVAALKLAPDAQNHAQFLDGLMGGIQKYLQMQAHASATQPGGAQAGMGGPGAGIGQPSPGGLGGNPGGPSAPPGMRIAPGGGAGMSGLMGGANPEELQKLLGAGAPG